MNTVAHEGRNATSGARWSHEFGRTTDDRRQTGVRRAGTYTYVGQSGRE